MLHAREILGHLSDERYRDRVVERLSISYDEAGKRRLRRSTGAGTDVAIDLAARTHLADGAVLADDGRRIVVVERRSEPALVVRFGQDASAETLLDAAVRLGHAFGNQHATLEVEGREVRIPLSTSEAVARATVDALELDGVAISVTDVALGSHRPLAGGRVHAHGHEQPATHAGRHEGRTAQLLVALQLSDSALPVGRFVHSHGLERWLQGVEADEQTLEQLIASMLLQSTAPLDGVAIAHAHATTDLQALADLDRLVTAHKLTAGARLASVSCGRQLAALATRLVEDTIVSAWAAEVRDGRTDGNLALAHGIAARALGLPAREAVLVELRGMVSGMLAACVRLGRLSPSNAQVMQARLGGAIGKGAEQALSLPLAGMHSSTPELEIAGMEHERADGRFFRT